MLNPIKRISSYPLLLKAVIQHCPPEDESSKSLLEKALVHVENIADIINSKKQERETKEKIATIKVIGLKEDLDVPGTHVQLI